MKLKDILSLSPLLEYTDKTINTTIERWQETNPSLDVNLAKQVIQRFDQVKSGLSTKLQQVALPDELKSGNNYLNIDKYSWDDMVKLLRSLPEKDDKIKKDAIAMFMEKEAIDKGIASSYVIRFMNNRRNLKYALENGTEDGEFTKEEVKKLVPQRLVMGGSYLDPRVWNFGQLEHMLDALFPYQGKVGEEEKNTATTDADKVYESNGIEIYRGDAQHKCVSYNPTEGGRKKYGWCIAQPGNSNYDYYRFQQGTNRMFYICFDRNQPESNKWHAFVIHVGENGSQYWATSAKNDGDNNSKTWGGLSKYVDPQTWAKIKDLKEVFKYIPPSKAEISSAALRGKKLSVNDFRELDYDTKEQYIQSNAGSLSPEILSILDKELKNLAINYGQKFPYSDLKDNEGLAKRYAVFRFRHTNYSKDPIPLPYVKYLDEEAKQKYLATFEDNLTYEYTEKFFGPQATEEYVQKQVDNFDFLPKEAIKYIKDPKQQKIFSIYSKLFDAWQFGDKTNLDEEELATSFDMPEQNVDPKPLNAKQWSTLSPEDKKVITNLAKQVNGKDKYSTLLYALPYILEDNGRDLYLLPLTNNDHSYENWVLVDENNKVVKKDIKGDEYNIGEQPLQLGFPNIDEDPRRVYPIRDLKKQSLNEIKVNIPKTSLEYPPIKNNPFESLEDLELAWQEMEQEIEDRMGNTATIANKEEWVDYGSKFFYIVDSNFEEKYGHEYQELYNYFDQFRKRKLRNPENEHQPFIGMGGLGEIKVNNPTDLYTILTSKENLPTVLGDIGYGYGTYGDIKGIIEQYVEDYNRDWEEVEEALLKVEKNYENQIEEWTDNEGEDDDWLLDDEEESFEEQFIRERLQSRAGLR